LLREEGGEAWSMEQGEGSKAIKEVNSPGAPSSSSGINRAEKYIQRNPYRPFIDL
jgi:hypothetical protein